MLKALVFDLDGTLIDTNKIHIKAFQKAFLENFKLSLKPSEITPFFGESAFDISSIILKKHSIVVGKEKINACVQENIELFDKASKGKRLMKKQTFKFLEKLKKQGVKLAIASGTERKMMLASLKPRERKLFGVLVCANDVKHAKPHPELLDLAVKKLKVKKKECVYIGDGLLDAKAAKNSGLKFAGFLSGIASKKEFEKAGAIVVVRKIQELSRVLRES